MKKLKMFLLVIFATLNFYASGTNPCTIGSRKGLYVELFGNVIINNPSYLTNLENYIINHNYNYILLYDLEDKVFSKSVLQTTFLNTSETILTSFILNLKNQNSNIQIGAVGGPSNGSGGLTNFFTNIDNYNSRVATSATDLTKTIDFNNLEDEYWGGGANDFLVRYNEYVNFTRPVMHNMDSLSNQTIGNYPHPKAEIYLGILHDLTDGVNSITAQDQANEIDNKMDRILLNIYIPSIFLQQECTTGVSNVDKLFLAYDRGSGHRLE